LSATSASATPLAIAASPPLRQVGAVVIGNALEFYDFVTYAFFAVQIGRAFFPSENPTSSLLMSLATFGAGFLMRPVGGLVIGRMGDRRGRKPAMLLSFACMGVAMIGLAVTPTYASIGLLAPVLVIAFRLLQGFALGGEVGPATAYLIEAAPVLRRGLYGSLQTASQGLAILLAGVVGIVLARVLGDAELTEWGWRIPFLLGTLIVPFGLYIRGRLPETLEGGTSRSAEPVPNATRIGDREDLEFAPRLARDDDGRLTRHVALLGLAMLASGTIATYVLAYLTTYATTTLKLRSDVAFGATAIMGLADLCLAPLSGRLSDRWGRKPLMLVPWVLLLGLTLPAFLLITHVTTSMTLLGATAVLATLRSLAIPAALVSLTEAIPARSRSGTIAITYALAVAIFGGTAQFIVAWLTDRTGNPLAPAWYMTAAVAVGLAAMCAMHESAPIKIQRS
jgi:MFS family permease